TVRIRRPIADHVSVRTRRGPSRCTSTSESDPNDSLDHSYLSFECEGIRDDDELTVELVEAFASVTMPGHSAASSTAAFTFEVARLTRYEPLCGVHIPEFAPTLEPTD